MRALAMELVTEFANIVLLFVIMNSRVVLFITAMIPKCMILAIAVVILTEVD
jgi:hypothetical protein